MRFLDFSDKKTKALAITLSACLVCGTVGGVAYSANKGDDTSLLNTSDTTAAGERAEKNETVYVMTSADGVVQKVIVSDELKNASQAAALKDKSDLSDITNVKGTETFQKNADGTITWDAQGKDIYYQGTSTKTAPVQVRISYTLDGKTISADELAGKSGKVVIRYDYSVDKDVLKEQNAENVPFLAMTGFIMDNANFSNITVSNGKLMDDGDRTVVMGFAFPGLKDTVNLGEDIAEVPESVEVSADTTGFKLSSTMTYATCEFAKAINTEKLKDADDLSGALDQLTSAVSQLTDGSSQLYEGLSTLLQKSGEMKNGLDTLDAGAIQLNDGATKLSNGLTTLDANSESLRAGAYQVFKTLCTEAQTQINAGLAAKGLGSVSLTPETYSANLTALLNSLSAGAYEQGQKAAEPQVRAKVEAAVREKAMESATQKVIDSAIAQGMTQEQAEAFAKSDTGLAYAKAGVEQYMSSDEGRQTVEAKVQEQLASAEVQAAIKEQVEAALDSNADYASIKAVKASLDQYAAFCQGINAYTAGVSSATAGAKQVSSGAQQVAAGAGKLQNGGVSLVTGVSQLRDGAMQLSDGMNEFVSAIKSKLSTLSGSEVTSLLPRVTSMLESARNYNNYSGIADGTDGSVRFIIKTASIGE
ncbi:MAG: hypothetical protein ACOX66_01235 [Oscillospiraceae bacterium]